MEYCAESENGMVYGHRMAALYGWLTLLTVWLGGSCSSLLLPSISKERCHTCQPGKRSKFQVWFLLNISLLHHPKV